LIKIKACAICTWEQREYSGVQTLYPLAGGHEVAGELVEMGKKVFIDAKPGDKVVYAALTRCVIAIPAEPVWIAIAIIHANLSRMPIFSGRWFK
jgi:NADPH:quinone reductase-like Zn-dependent oxidoreductase